MSPALPFTRPVRRPHPVVAEVRARPGDATARIQAALDGARQGSVRLGPGLHLCGGLRLRSHVDLVLAEGAVLAAQTDYEAFAGTLSEVVAEESDRALILARDVQDAGIFGAGTIDGGSEAWHSGFDAAIGTRTPVRHRPRLLVAEHCRGLDLAGIRMANSPLWTVHLVGCRDVVIEGVTIDNDAELPNTDGIVIDSSCDVAVRACSVSAADDGICLKTSRRPDGSVIGPCSRIAVTDCTVRTRSCALKIGTETHADISDVVFADCRVPDANRGLGIFSRDGGAITAIRFQDVSVCCRETPVGFWGSGEPLTINALDRSPDRPAGAVQDVTVSGLSGHGEGAIVLYAESEGRVRDVVIRDVDLEQRPGRLGTARFCDLRPTRTDRAVPAGATGRPNAWVRLADGSIAGLNPYPAGLPALFAHNVAGLVIERAAIRRPEPLPAGWDGRSRRRTPA